MGQSNSMSVAAVAGALLLAVMFSGCFDVGGDSNAADISDVAERDRIAEAFEELQHSVEIGNASEVCAGLGAKAREQVAGVGHDVLQDCYRGVTPLLKGLKEERLSNGSGPGSEVSDARVVVRATVKIEVADETVRVPFVQEQGRWKLDSFYGLSPRLAVAVP